MKKSITHNGVTMGYTVEGDGSPVILMHGWGCTRDTVKSIADVAAEHHRVYNVDFPGFGVSTEPPADTHVWGVDDYTRMIERLIEVENIERPTLIGHSFGGRVAIHLASRNDVAKVVLVDAAGVKPHRPLKYYYKVYTFKAAKHLSRIFMGRKRSDEYIARQRAKRGSSDYASSTPVMRAVMSKVVNEDLCHEMPLIKAPTLLIWGDNDTATPLADALKMNKLIPDSGLVRFANAGHYSFLDQPVRFGSVLRSFLNS